MTTRPSRGALRAEMAGHAEAERKCVTVSGSRATINIDCMKKAVPKGTNKGVWTEGARRAARNVWTD